MVGEEAKDALPAGDFQIGLILRPELWAGIVVAES